MGEDLRHRLQIAGLIVAITGVVLAAYWAIANGKHFWPYSPAAGGSISGSYSPRYQHIWGGHIPVPGTTIDLTLSLGPGGVNDAVGSISSSTLGCAEVVYLEKADDPITLRLDASDSSAGCALASFFNSATIELLNDDSLEFTVNALGMSESSDLSR